jgi:predicted AAA+ superfamily ATPase
MQKSIIVRKEYSKRIRPFINKSLIKVLMGQRRVGKTYILRQLSKDIRQLVPNANIIFIDKELDEFSAIRNNKDLYTYVNTRLQDKDNYLFIDEVQEIVSFELALRSLLNEEKCDICLPYTPCGHQGIEDFRGR